MAHHSIHPTYPQLSAPQGVYDQAESNARIHELVHYDTLTGLPNPTQMEVTTRKVIEVARQDGSGFSMVVLNLDNFRFVNEGFGRGMGDVVLRRLALSLTEIIGNRDGVARVGANEFLVILPRIATREEAEAIARRLLDSIAAPRKLLGQRIQLSASAGIAIYPHHGADFETLLQHATAAMHESKASCPGGCKLYGGEVEHGARQQLQLTSDLRHAIEHHELSIHYQPQYEMRSGLACGVEALARWFPHGGASIPPAQFIAHAEQTGLIASLGAWVLQQACSTVCSWESNAQRPSILCVNVSSLQISPEFTDTLSSTLRRTGFPAARLELEITESALIESPELALACFQQWKDIGVRIAIDDFGTGYSSLGYLSRFPVDRVKIDRSLVQRMVADRKTAAIVHAVILLGEELGCDVLAEGIETGQHFDMLAAMGCRQGQGYLFARPVSDEEARPLMDCSWGMRGNDASLPMHHAAIASHAS